MAIKPRKFNPLAAFGTVTPPHNGAVHYQDGGYFGPDGNILFEDHPATPARRRTSSVIVVDSEDDTIKEEEVVEDVVELEPGDPRVILAAWLKGEGELTFVQARGYAKAAYNVILVSKAELITYLVETANLVPAELVKVK